VAPVGPDDMSVERAYLGVEIGELAAWVAVTCGKSGAQRRWRASFGAPPTPDVFLERLADGVRSVCGDDAIAGIGIASWAPVDSERGAIGAASIMPEWADIALTAHMSKLFGAPCQLLHAVSAAALAEATLGAGKGTSSMVYAHLGREVLSALVYHGALVAGAHGEVGQIGHWRVTEDGPRCACGAVGHLNPLCSSQGIVRLAIGLAAQDERALAEVSRVTGGRAEALTASGVVALAGAGIEPLRDLVRRSADALGLALAQLSLLAHPALIVLGGPLGLAGGLFMERTHERLAQELSAIPAAGTRPLLAPALLEPHGALTGAWLLAHRLA
jgi:predicted NBD/HSP70 family sugar kinase